MFVCLFQVFSMHALFVQVLLLVTLLPNPRSQHGLAWLLDILDFGVDPSLVC